MRDEGELVRAAAAGDAEAFDALVRLKREQVVRTAYQVIGDVDEAQDVAQQVFLRLWRNLDRYDRERRFDTWLYRITVNAAIDQLRARGPKAALQPLPAEPGAWAVDAAPGGGPERALDLAQLQRAFARLAAGLSPKQRAAFVLREIEGLDTAEVARVLGVRESTVRNHLLQARRILRAGLERDYPGLVPAASQRAVGGDS
jgi:RNA polymerase sigma-70 factor (ECF subfamily)